MLGIELSALSAAEVNRLLEVARARGNATLERQLVAELAARRTRHAGWTTESLQFVRLADPEPEPAFGRRAPRPALAGLAATAVVALALGWGVSVELAPRLDGPPAAPAPARVMLARTTPVTVAPPPVVEAPAAPVARAAPEKHNPCLDLPTPGERLVCGYPALAAQEREVAAAFDRAMASAADPDAVERAQAAWRQARDRTWDRTELADLNVRRLQELAAPPAAAP